ncbi:hypothetical protein EGW08_016172 [Elysia chlorotica]|uniref:Carboxylic ester hydrolase n=1 Tax=Elysia chlorotica TaxID=188477 RepID=A0A433T3D3_ELYCH|nr:hypothetical protein EGW08_016172 [Elysia chlorotica]
MHRERQSIITMATPAVLAVLYTALISSLLQEQTTTGAGSQPPGDGVLVSVSSGQLRGVRRTLDNGQVVHEFKGIPYAQPPTGALRFAAPEPPLPWSGVRDASRHGNHCPQNGTQGLLSNSSSMSEDCLFLDIYSPSPAPLAPSPSSSLLPVMVWIHGGGFNLGSGSDYNGAYLATKGQVVVVTLNYRLGPLGFLSTEDDVIPGNFGMLDQVMALKWVRLNIRHFGGDPGQVTVHGQSAGGHSVSLLALSPLATGLFQRAIAQSGAAITPSSLSRQSERISPRETAGKIGAKVGCLQQDSPSLLKCLRSKTVNELMDADQAVFAEANKDYLFLLMWKPRVDGPSGFLPDEPEVLLSKGLFADVDTMHGFCADELGVLVNDTDNDGVSLAEFKEAAAEILALYKLDKLHITEQAVTTFLYGVTSPLERRSKLTDLLSNFNMAAPITHEVDTIVRTPTASSDSSPGVRRHFLYRFSYRGNMYPQYPSWIGVPHGAELPFLFGLHLNNQSIWFGDRQPTPADEKVSELVIKIWSNFARYGHPTGQFQVQTAASWPEFTAGQRLVLDITESLAVQTLDWTDQDDVYQLMNKQIL